MQTLITALGYRTLFIGVRLLILGVFVFGGFRLIELSRRIIDKRLVQQAGEPSRRARLATLLDAYVRTAQLLLLVAVVLMALTVIGIDIGPVLAAAGIAGLAISLGAQALIRDFIGGVLILVEDQFRVGDVIRVETAEGTVERISLRASYVRDVEGRLWVVPNGNIRLVSNSTRDWSRAVLDLNLKLGVDMGQAVRVLEEAMGRAAQEPEMRDMLLETPVIEGWNSLNDWSVQVRVKVMTKAGQQWAVARLLRQWALDALREAGIPVGSG